jgi:hypothetical protein
MEEKQPMRANPPEKVTRRVAVILEAGGSSRHLLDVVLPLLGRDKAIEMQGVFLEEAELKHAADLPFVKELCRVTFSIREFNSDQFERVLALRMRTAQRALSVLAKRAGVAHSFRNVRGSAISLLVEIANQSDITIFKPARMMAAAMSPKPYKMPAMQPIVVAISDFESGGRALLAASHLASGDVQRVSVLLTPSVASDAAALERLFTVFLPAPPGRIQTISDYGVSSLTEAAQAEGATMLVVSTTPELMDPDTLQLLRQRVRCPICLVRQWGENVQ